MPSRGRLRALDQPVVIGLIVLAGVTLFTGGRLHRVGGDPSEFVVPGRAFVDPDRAVASPAVWVEDWAFMGAAAEFDVLAYTLLLAAPPPLLAIAGLGQVAVAVPVLESLARSR